MGYILFDYMEYRMVERGPFIIKLFCFLDRSDCTELLCLLDRSDYTDSLLFCLLDRYYYTDSLLFCLLDRYYYTDSLLFCLLDRSGFTELFFLLDRSDCSLYQFTYRQEIILTHSANYLET